MSPVFNRRDLSMVLTTSFPTPLLLRLQQLLPPEERTPPPGSLGPGKLAAERVVPPAHAQCACGGSREQVQVLSGLGTCFESPREVLWGWQVGAGCITCRRQQRRPRKVPFLPRPAPAELGAPPPPHPSAPRPRLLPRRATRRLRGRPRLSRWRPPRVLCSLAGPPPPLSIWCGPWRAHHGD